MKILKFIKLIAEGKTIKDKLKIMLFFLGFPKEIDLKNSDGLFHARANKSDLWMCTPLADRDMRKYFAPKEGTFLDIGANIGKYSIIMAKNPDVKVIAFEPEPSNLKALRSNIALNSFEDRITIASVALSDKRGVVNFYQGRGDPGVGSLEMTGGKTENVPIKVNTQPLDDYAEKNKIQDIKLMKVDVEGLEASVFRGALKTLRKFHPKIIFEAQDENHLNESKNILEAVGYKIKQIDDTNFLAK